MNLDGAYRHMQLVGDDLVELAGGDALHHVALALGQAGEARTALFGAGVGVLQLHLPDAAGYACIVQLFVKYADQNPDWTDLELVWLAEATGITRIATPAVADFSVCRIHGHKRLELELLR